MNFDAQRPPVGLRLKLSNGLSILRNISFDIIGVPIVIYFVSFIRKFTSFLSDYYVLYFFIFVNYIAFYFKKCYYFGGGFMDKKKNIIILVVTSIIFILLLILFIVSINKGKETINELKPNNDANIKSASKATVNNEVSNKSNDKDEDETITRQIIMIVV